MTSSSASDSFWDSLDGGPAPSGDRAPASSLEDFSPMDFELPAPVVSGGQWQDSGAVAQQQPHPKKPLQAKKATSLGNWALVIAVAGVVVAGVASFLGLESVDVVSANPLGDLLTWFTVVGVAGLAGCISAIMAVTALAKGGSRLVPLIALAVVLLVGPLATYTGLMAGLDDVKSETTSDVATLVGDSAVPAVVQALLAALERTGN